MGIYINYMLGLASSPSAMEITNENKYFERNPK